MFGRAAGGVSSSSATQLELAADRKRRGTLISGKPVVAAAAASNASAAAAAGAPGAKDVALDDEVRRAKAEASFNEWVRWKDRFDRGLELFARLDASRAESDVSTPATATASVTLACTELCNLQLL
jgi:hypothetical protein